MLHVHCNNLSFENLYRDLLYSSREVYRWTALKEVATPKNEDWNTCILARENESRFPTKNNTLDTDRGWCSMKSLISRVNFKPIKSF